ncbi:MAG: outer membrane protein assembly factor BamC [Gammaproteobacteria bacterium]
MRRFVPICLSLLLAACAGEGGSHYRDTSALERPPTLPIEKNYASPEESAADESSEPAEQEEDVETPKKGLGDRVRLTETQPPEIRIKQSFDVAWNSLYQALNQSGIDITDRQRDQGKIYVSYDADAYTSDHGSLLERSVGLFSDDYDEQTYVLTLLSEGSETKITAAPSKDAEYKKRTDQDDAPSAETEESAVTKPKDGADKLLKSVFLTLHDELRENP